MSSINTIYTYQSIVYLVGMDIA